MAVKIRSSVDWNKKYKEDLFLPFTKNLSEFQQYQHTGKKNQAPGNTSRIKKTIKKVNTKIRAKITKRKKRNLGKDDAGLIFLISHL